jgi:hypothetical protein
MLSCFAHGATLSTKFNGSLRIKSPPPPEAGPFIRAANWPQGLLENGGKGGI